MGVEAFGLTLQLIAPEPCGELKTLLEQYPHFCRWTEETTAHGSIAAGEYNDGSHIIECQLIQEPATCSLAIRFSLCSFDSIDQAFIDLVKHVLSYYDAEVWLMTSAIQQKEHYPLGESIWLSATLPDEIIAMRKHWQKLFGAKQGVVRVKDSFSFVGVKQ